MKFTLEFADMEQFYKLANAYVVLVDDYLEKIEEIEEMEDVCLECKAGRIHQIKQDNIEMLKFIAKATKVKVAEV